MLGALRSVSKMGGSALPAFSVDFRKFTPEMIRLPTDDIIKRIRKRIDCIAEMPDSEVTCRSVVGGLADIDSELDTFTSYMARLPANAATEKTVRDAASDAEKMLQKFNVELSMRKDIFDKLVYLSEKADLSVEHAQTRRFIEKRVIKGRRNGLHLDQETRDELRRLQERITEATIEFSKNCSEDTTWLPFSEHQLAGLPSLFIESLERTQDGRCKISLLAPHFIVMRLCSNEETRRQFCEARASKCQAANTPLIEEFVRLMHRHAVLLGYESNAHYKTAIKMARTPETVRQFLADLRQHLRPLWDDERREFETLKREQAAAAGGRDECSTAATYVKLWDVQYLSTMVENRRYAVDHELLRQYFPIERVMSGVFDIYQQLLGLCFSEVADASVWHDEVRLFRVTEADRPDTVTGYFYLDLFPRDGKYDHFCVDSLRCGRELPSVTGEVCDGDDGREYEVPVCVMLANFPRPSGDLPSLLDHGEVTTFFHEFGHAMHCICSRAKYSMFSGITVEDDFVEAPSQMLENWVWQPETLAMMSGHHRDGSPIPARLVEALVRSRCANSGVFNLRQVALSTFDQEIFSRERSDTAAVFASVYRDVCGLDAMPGTNFAASFGHMAGGYDANYYGYLWSEVYSADMFETRFKHGEVLSAEVGRQYRKCILEPGSTRDAIDMVTEFLGRPPNNKAFLASKGIKVDS